MSTRIAVDLVEAANVVASLQKRSAADVIDDILRGPLLKLRKAEIAKAAKADEKEGK